MGNNIKQPLAKTLVDLHNTHGYSYFQYFQWFVDDCLAGFGVKVIDTPPNEVLPILFELGQRYAHAVASAPPFYDLLGSTYMELVSQYGKQMLGQYFTPWHVAGLISRINWDPSVFDRKPSVSVGDPSCGSGVMLLAFAACALDQGGEQYLKRISFQGVDLDRFCCRIAALQLLGNSFLHNVKVGEVLILHGNALGSPDALKPVVHVSQRDFPRDVPHTVAGSRPLPTVDRTHPLIAASGQYSLF